MKKKTPDANSSTTPPLVKALEKNDSVKKVVKQSADDLLVVNAVLEKGIPAQAKKGDLAQALEKTQHIEGTIQTSAEDLVKVNQLLAHEVAERAELEQQLLTTKKALSKAKAQLKKQ